MPPYPAIGSMAPDFSAPAVGQGLPENATITLASLRGQRVILYFYPKDATPGCTTQACSLRDAWPEIQSRAALLGISTDSPASHQRFILKNHLPFPLISDPDHSIASNYGVWVEKNLYGRKSMGTERTTFLISPSGTIESVFPKVSPASHTSLLLGALTSLTA
jgi:peroxiredoxin Q/BCP